MRTLVAMCMIVFCTAAPRCLAEYVYSKSERANLIALAEQLEAKADEVYTQAYDEWVNSGASVERDPPFYALGLAEAYLDSARQIREEADRRKPKVIWLPRGQRIIVDDPPPVYHAPVIRGPVPSELTR